MKQFEYIQKDIQSITSGIEMAGYLGGIEAAATVWCKKNDPDNIYVTESGETKVAIFGMTAYLNSEV